MLAFNRTIEELKSAPVADLDVADISFNRTIEELKSLCMPLFKYC